MSKIYKDYKYFLSHNVNLDIIVLISSIDLTELDLRGTSSFPVELQQQVESGSELRNSPQNEIFASVQLFADRQPMHTLPISTRNPPRCNGSSIRWNEWIKLPVKYRDLPRNATMELSIWAVGGRRVGVATCRLFNDKFVLQDGLQRIPIFETDKRQTDMSETYDFTIEETPLEKESYRLDKLKEEYDRKEMIRSEWLDQLTFKQMARIRQSAELPEPKENLEAFSPVSQSDRKHPYLWIEFPFFGHKVLYEEECYASRPVPYFNDPKRTSPDLSSTFLSTSSGVSSLPSPAFSQYGPPTVGTPLNSTSSTVASASGGEMGEGKQLLHIWDPELGEVNPVEIKYRKLARDILRGSIDPNLKPNREEKEIIERILSNLSDDLRNEEKDLIWKFRFTLTDNPKAITKFLISVDWNDEEEAKQATELMQQWAPIDIADGLKLLGRQKEFKQDQVRLFAVNALSRARDEELLDYLLQLVQALRYERPSFKQFSIESNSSQNDLGPLAKFLISRAKCSFQLSNFFYWYLRVEMSGTDAEGQLYKSVYDAFLRELDLKEDSRYIAEMLALQEKYIGEISRHHLRARDTRGRKDQKEEKLRTYLATMKWPKNCKVRVPLDPSMLVTGVVPSSASMFKSALYPAVIEFKCSPESDTNHLEKPIDSGSATTHSGDGNQQSGGDSSNIRDSLSWRVRPSKSVSRMTNIFGKERDEVATFKVMFKSGDDLRQDQLVMQMFILMDRLLKRVNLDLKLTPYRVLATSKCDGLMEFVLNSYPVSYVVANFEGTQILSFLRKHQPDPNTKEGVSATAMSNYVKSLAGYCVLTYLLGIGDRHLDNVMLTTEGHLFHIDFGFILDRDPKPYPPPFKLTKEMVEGMGGPKSEHYIKFKTYCCQAYNWLRKSASLILNLMNLMLDAGIEELSTDPATTLAKVHEKFRLDLTDEQAEQFFLGLINDSVTALFPVLMEIVHKIATKLK